MKNWMGLGLTVVVAAALGGGCGSDDEGGGPSDTLDAGGTGASAGTTATGGAGGSATGGSATGGATTGGTAGTGAVGTGGTIDVPDARSPEQTGDSCETADECYPNVDHELLSGPVACLTQVEDGYCTHECTADEECCAAPGECQTDLKQVCSPFTYTTGTRYCFLSCEDADLRDADGGVATDGGLIDPDEYCKREAHPSFVCRSTGGGAANRKVCLPGGAAGDGGTPDLDGSIPPDGSLDAATGADATADGSADASPD
jgi:hypothetical protein